MTVLVTGGTGFVGGAIVRSLLAAGEQVRVLARPTSVTGPLVVRGVDIARGDVLDRGSIESALKGCDMLFHAASPFDFWIPDRRVMNTTVAGTRNAFEAALRVGVKRAVYTSAASTIGEQRGAIGIETTHHRGYHLTLYERSEYEAEQVAASFVGRGLPLVTVNPASVYGPGNFKPVGRGLISLLNHRTPAKFNGTVSYVYIDDVGAGHLLAATKGLIGERYILSGQIVTMQAWFKLACRLAGTRVPPTVPLPGARLFAEFGEGVARFTKRAPLLPRDLLRICAHGFAVDGSKAERELGLVYTSLEEGLRRSIRWYWDQGLVKYKPACVETEPASRERA